MECFRENLCRLPVSCHNNFIVTEKGNNYINVFGLSHFCVSINKKIRPKVQSNPLSRKSVMDGQAPNTKHI